MSLQKDIGKDRCTNISLSFNMYIYIYILKEREREIDIHRRREGCLSTLKGGYICIRIGGDIYVYLHTHLERERN